MIEQTLEERGKIYGGFTENTCAIAEIMTALNKVRLDQNKPPLSEFERVTLFWIASKLTRLAVTPGHLDSWHDIAGYAKLAEDHYENT